MRENFANFATTTLNGTITSGATSFAVATGQGALFPATNFEVSIDSECIFVGSRSGDTMSTLTRGFDGTTAAGHNSGVTVQLATSSYNFTHLWQNVADTYTPPVPPVQLGNSPSSFDNEFESAGSWTLFPNAGGSTTWNAGTSLRSHLVLNRGSGDNALYTAYVAYTSSAAATFTCKLMHSTSLLRSSTDQAHVDFFVSDQTNPTNGPDTGTRVKLNSVLSSTLSNNFLTNTSAVVRSAIDTNGVPGLIGPYIPVSPGLPLYLRLTYDGAGNWATFYGDGTTYWNLVTKASFLTAPQSLGISFHILSGGLWVPQVAAIDYVRIVQGSVLPPFGG